LTTKGDLLTRDASAVARLGVGSNGQVLAADSGATVGLAWANVGVPTGAVSAFAGSTAPTGWLLCSGQAVSRTTYAALFALIGTTYGVGDGSTTFNLPDLRGRVVAGEDDMGGTAANRLTSGVSGITGTTLGAAGGDERLQQHQHANTASFTGSAVNTGNQSADHTHSGTTGNNNANHSHSGTTGTMNSNWSHSHSQVYNGAPSGAALDGTKISYGTVLDLAWRNVSISATDTNHTHNFSTGTQSANHAHSFSTGGMSASHTHSVTASGTVTVTNVNQGSGTAQNVQPTIVLNYIIKF